MAPWIRPIIDVFKLYYSQSELNDLLHNDKLEICPIAYMRGRTFHDSFVIADEMQNSTPKQMKTLCTRMGMNSKLILLGDNDQSDINDMENGLYDISRRVKYGKSKIISIISLTNSDIFRSSLTKEILEIYHDENVLKSNNQISNSTKSDHQTSIINFESTNSSDIKSNLSIYSSSQEKQINYRNTKNSDCAIIPSKHISKYYIE